MPTPVRPNVLRMVPYSPGKPIDEVKRELGLDSVIKMASNENPIGPSPKAIAAIQSAMSELNLYPDGAAFGLKHAISEKFGIPAENIVIGNGSDEIIQNLGVIFLGKPTDEVIAATPSFSRYEAVGRLADCKVINVPLDKDLRHDLNAMAAAVTPNTKLVFIANPNNPTGTIISKTEFDAFLAKIPDSVTVILDEAYYEFACDTPDYVSSIPYVLAGRNVVGLRTFSKAYGLAGLRVGYGFVPNWIEDPINRARLTFNVNNLAQLAGIAALGDDEHVRRTLENNKRGIEILTKGLEAEGAAVTPTYTNFIFADIHRSGREVFNELLKRGVIIRPGDIFGAPTFLRITVGTEAENLAFVEAFHSIMRQPATI